MSSTQHETKLSDRHNANETISSAPASGSETPDEAGHQNAQLFSPRSRASWAFIVPIIFDSVLLSGGILHLILVFKAITIKDASTTSSFGRNIEELQRWSATIYPVLFGALMSRSLKNIGRYIAERGIQLSNLCLMMNSSLLYDPMVNFVYAPFSAFTILLFLLWACSPIGGQSSLRLVHKGNITVITHEEIRYQDTGPLGLSTIIPHHNPDVYAAAFTQAKPTTSGPVDNWGNIKIPRLGAFSEHSIKPDEHGWYDVKELPAKFESWSAMYGLPIIGLAQYDKRKVSFTVQSMHTALACDKGNNVTLDLNSPLNITSSTDDEGERFSALLGDLSAQPTDTSAKLIQTNFPVTAYKWNCTVSLQPVETQIQCKYGSCVAAKIRDWKHNPFGGRNYTPFDRGDTAFNPIIKSCPVYRDRLGHEMGCSSAGALCGFTNFDTSGIVGCDLPGSPYLQGMPARYSSLLNTVLSSTYAGYGLFGNLPYDNLSVYGAPHKPDEGLIPKHPDGTLSGHTNSAYWDRAEGIPFVGASANATVVSNQEVYNPNYIWCLLSLVSSTSLFMLGLGGIYCHCRSLTPNMFDPVIGWTYMNPYISLPPLAADTEYPLAAERRLGALGKTIVRLGRPHDQAIVPSLDESSCETLQEDADKQNTKQTRSNDNIMSFSPVVLGAADHIQRLRRKDGYQGSAENA